MERALRNQKVTLSAEAVIADYRLAYSSRRASVIGRAEVLRGNATFGIFGDGKEVANIAMAKAFRPGDWRAGYYRDQTFMWATRMSNVRAFFAQLYGTASIEADPASGGRQMGNHFATRFLDDHGAFGRHAQLERRRVERRRLDASTGRPRICVKALPRQPAAEGGTRRVLRQRRRGGLRHHR
jgi:TPP-dependent pyruvate/acetoin dehydrogenase alpha subunit